MKGLLEPGYGEAFKGLLFHRRAAGNGTNGCVL